MAGLKELKRRISSVKNTKKITYAMKLVSAAKLKRAQEASLRSRSYTDALRDLLVVLQKGTESVSFSHPLLDIRTPRHVRVIVIGGARGLAGAYNTNLQKGMEALLGQFRQRGFSLENGTLSLVALGKKPIEYFRRMRYPIEKAYEDLPEDPLVWPLEEVYEDIAQDFIGKKIDEVYVVYTKFRSALSMTVECERLLPLASSQLEGHEVQKSSGNILFEPSPQEVYTSIIPQIVRSLVRQAAFDAKASEHASRMTAMDAASKNAGELIDRLQLQYNKLRQSGITSELLDIIGGAEAVS